MIGQPDGWAGLGPVLDSAKSTRQVTETSLPPEQLEIPLPVH